MMLQGLHKLDEVRGAKEVQPPVVVVIRQRSERLRPKRHPRVKPP